MSGENVIEEGEIRPGSVYRMSVIAADLDPRYCVYKGVDFFAGDCLSRSQLHVGESILVLYELDLGERTVEGTSWFVIMFRGELHHLRDYFLSKYCDLVIPGA